MKRYITFITILLISFLVTGCTSAREIESDTSSLEGLNKEIVVNDKKNEVSVKDFSIREIDEQIDNIPMYHLVIDAKDDKGNIVWSYTTENGIRAELEANQFLARYKDKTYISESGNIIALDSNTGKKIWENNDFEGGQICFAFDDEDTIYLTGYYSGEVYGIDKNGQTVLKANMASGWCHKIIIEGEYLKIYSADDGDYFYVNKNDGISNYFNCFPNSNIAGGYKCERINKLGGVLIDIDIFISKGEDNKLHLSTDGYFTVNVKDEDNNYLDPDEAPVDALYNLRTTGVEGEVRQIDKNKYEAFLDTGFVDLERIEIFQINDNQIKTTIFTSNIEEAWIFTKYQ